MMEDETSNIEWSKKGFEDQEKLTLKTNIKQALQYKAKQKSPIKSPNLKPLPADLPKGLKKIRKKIKRDAYDDEEDEEENSEIFNFMPAEANSSLLNALHEDEKKLLQQQETLKTMNIQQTAGKMEAMLTANKISKDLGLKGLKTKTVNSGMQDATLNSDTFDKILQKDLSQKLHFSPRKLSESETVTMLRGIKRIQNMALAADESRTKAIENLKIEDLVRAGKETTDDKIVAEIVLEKTGRKNDDKKKLVQKSKGKNKSKDPTVRRGLQRD